MRFWGASVLVVSLGCALPERPVGTPPPEPESWAETTLRKLSLEEKVGQMICPRSEGLFANEADPRFRELSAAARSGRIGGVVFFRGDPFSTAAIANRLQEQAPLPLLMASDYEWGTAMRVERASRFPKAMVLGAGGTERDLEYQAEVTAREARALGIRLLLNPVLDLNVHSENTVIDVRSFGSDPQRAARLGAAYIRRAQQLGVLTTAKHFPGHGATTVDSHVGLPVTTIGKEALNNVELVPFRSAIEAGVAAVMPAHMAVPALDGRRDRPATLSPEILQGFLREVLGFDGLIVSDALDMGGARAAGWDGAVAVAAVKAGVDLLLLPPSPAVAHQAIVRAVRHGEIAPARIDASVQRILEAKEGLGLHERRTVDLRDLPRRLAEPNVAERIEAMAGRGVTLLENDDTLVPFASRKPLELLLVDFLPDGERSLEPDVLFGELQRRAGQVRRIQLSPQIVRYRDDPIERRAGEILVLAHYERTVPQKLRLLLPASSEKLVVVSLGSPYVLRELPRASTVLAAYDSAPASQRAVARALFGEIAVSGKLPVAVSAEYPQGRSIEVAARRMRLEKMRRPEEVGFSDDGLREAVRVLEKAIGDRATPGAVALVARRGKIVLETALGKMSYEEDASEVTPDTMYDLASLTKVVVTTTLAMLLYERGLLELERPVASYLPEFHGEKKDEVRVEDLLAHSGGLLWWTELYKKFEGKSPEEARRGYIETIARMPLDYPPRTKTSYSDLGILLVGEILERVTGKRLDVLAREEIFDPLGMVDTLYRPPVSMRSRIAPTEQDEWRGRTLRGEVHDENAFGLGGVAPHAGLFSTARSLAAFAQMMSNKGAYNGERLLNPKTIERFTRRANLVPGSSRALGWDTPSEPSSSGIYFSSSSYGHTGFTGTSLWIDPERELFVILLTNRVHPTRENRLIEELRPAFHDAVMRAIEDVPIEPRSGAN